MSSPFVDRNQALANIPGFEQIVSNNPTDWNTMANLASCYFVLGDIDKALHHFENAYAGNPGSAEICMNLGMAYKDLGRMADCARLVQQAHNLDPEFFYIRLGYAECLLRFGHWKEAWLLYEHARFTRKSEHDMHCVPVHVAEWKSLEQKIPGKLIVFGEGGWGDRICYSRWLPKLTERGIDWVYHPNALPPAPGFTELMKMQPFCAERIVDYPLSFEGVTHWTTTFALQAIFEATPASLPQFSEPFHAGTQYHAAIAQLRELAPHKPVFGIIWSAGEKFEGDRKFRSLSDAQAMRIVVSTADIITWVGCQYGQSLPFPVENPQFQRWDEAAALQAALDGIVAVDTGPMHLAGALAKPMSIVLSGNSDWKFLMKTERCYFWPTARLFRNETAGFELAIDKLIASLRAGEIGKRKWRISTPKTPSA